VYVKRQKDFAIELIQAVGSVIAIESGTRSTGIFAPYASVSFIPLMRFATVNSQKWVRGKSPIVAINNWAGLTTKTVQTLWEIANELSQAAYVRKIKEKFDKDLRYSFIRLMQYFARMFSISLACTGHMRSEDWYNMVCRCVFGQDVEHDDCHKLTSQAADNIQRYLHVPGCSAGLRELVWNLREILEAHSTAFKAKTCCLSGVLIEIEGTQLKKLNASEGKKNSNYTSNDPNMKYNINALVDGEWGVMSAGNVMVLARGILELFDRIAATLEQAPCTYRNVLERCSGENGNKSLGGPSYMATALRSAFEDNLAVYSVKSGLAVKVITVKERLKKCDRDKNGNRLSTPKYSVDFKMEPLSECKVICGVHACIRACHSRLKLTMSCVCAFRCC
jgi:hypothetical protein